MRSGCLSRRTGAPEGRERGAEVGRPSGDAGGPGEGGGSSGRAGAGQEQGRSSRGLCFSAGEAAAFKTNREWGVSGEGEARAFGLGNS